MNSLRRPLLFTATSLLRTVLFLGVSLIDFILYFGSANYLESTLKDAQVYETFLPAVAETLGKVSQADQGIPFNGPGVRQIFSNGLPPQL